MIVLTRPVPTNAFEMYRQDRTYYFKQRADTEEIRVDSNHPGANLVSSQIDGTTRHSPILDVDDPEKIRFFCSLLYVQAIPGLQIFASTSPDHYHVYLNAVEITWAEYEFFLREMKDLGIISKGYFEFSVARKATYLRPPWIKKQVGDAMPSSGPAVVTTGRRFGSFS